MIELGNRVPRIPDHVADELAGHSWVDSPCNAPPVPDLTLTGGRFDAPLCSAFHPTGYSCTRLAGHRRRHAAGMGTRIVAVWS